MALEPTGPGAKKTLRACSLLSLRPSYEKSQKLAFSPQPHWQVCRGCAKTELNKTDSPTSSGPASKQALCTARALTGETFSTRGLPLMVEEHGFHNLSFPLQKEEVVSKSSGLLVS